MAIKTDRCWHSTSPRWLATAVYHPGCTMPMHCCTARRSTTSTGCRWRKIRWSGQFVKPLSQPVPPSCVVSFTGCQFDSGFPTRSLSSPTRHVPPANRLTSLHLLQDYRPAWTLRSSDKLLLSVPRMALAFSAKAFSVSAPSVWNSLSYPVTCYWSYQRRSAELFSSFRRILKTELFDIAYSERKQSA